MKCKPDGVAIKFCPNCGMWNIATGFDDIKVMGFDCKKCFTFYGEDWSLDGAPVQDSIIQPSYDQSSPIQPKKKRRLQKVE